MDDVWQPVGKMIIVTKDDDKEVTKGGIVLPGDSKIPVITCRVTAIGPSVDMVNYPIQKYYRVLVAPSSAIPISFESDNKRYVIDSEKILAIQEPTSRKKVRTNTDNSNDIFDTEEDTDL